MKKNISDKLTNFLDDEEELDDEIRQKKKISKKELLSSKTGLIERVDKIFITEDGRQLLREQY